MNTIPLLYLRKEYMIILNICFAQFSTSSCCLYQNTVSPTQWKLDRFYMNINQIKICLVSFGYLFKNNVESCEVLMV